MRGPTDKGCIGKPPHHRAGSPGAPSEIKIFFSAFGPRYHGMVGKNSKRRFSQCR